MEPRPSRDRLSILEQRRTDPGADGDAQDSPNARVLPGQVQRGRFRVAEDGVRNGTPEQIGDQIAEPVAHQARHIDREFDALAVGGPAAGDAEPHCMAVLGLATGSTPQGVYDELVRLHKEEGSHSAWSTFNLDEYHPMAPTSLQSYRRFMREHLFDRVDIDPKNANVPDGTVRRRRRRLLRAYERAIKAAGGIDLQILGIGRTGHVGFNEPGSPPRNSRTRLITLDSVTRMDAASDFFGEWNVPRRRSPWAWAPSSTPRRVLIAFGEHKAGS
jgi:glucosamine-6-phosphate isomerase